MTWPTQHTVTEGRHLAGLAWLRASLDGELKAAEAALVNASRQGASPAELLRCLWAIHHVTAGLRSIGLYRASLLSTEMERSLRQLLLHEVAVERHNLILGGLMRGVQTLPACLDALEETGGDSGNGLVSCVNDLRRWRGDPPRPAALFFQHALLPDSGITSVVASDEDAIRRAAGLLLAPWVQGARGVLAGTEDHESARTLGRIAHKLQRQFRGHCQERFWLGMTGLCEGLAVGMFLADEAIAQILKAGALLIKQAREHGSEPLASVDSDRYLQQILFYHAACPVHTRYMQHVCELFAIDDRTLDAFQRPPIHRDAIRAVLDSADQLLQSLMDELESGDDAAPVKDRLDALELRLIAAGDQALQQRLETVRELLEQDVSAAPELREQNIADAGRQLVEMQLAIQRRRRFRGRQLEDADRIEQQQALVASAHRRLLGVIQQLDVTLGGGAPPGGAPPGGASPNDDPDTASGEDLPQDPQAAVAELSAALRVAGREREAGILTLVRDSLHSRVGNPAMAGSDLDKLAFALAALEHYWDLYLADPRAEDTSLVDAALESLSRLQEPPESTQTTVADDDDTEEDDTAADPENDAYDFSPGAAEDPGDSEEEIPEYLRAVFAEEAEEQLESLQTLLPVWEQSAARDDTLREMRRHFHTFKGNGQAVGAERIAELGREAQDMLDRVLDSSGPVDAGLAPLLRDLIAVLPGLVAGDDRFARQRLPELVDRCRRVQWGGGG